MTAAATESAMLLIRKRAIARAGLIGNPSDGYHGKTISLIVRNFWAEVVLYEWEDVELLLSQEDRSRFSSVSELVADVRHHGYYGGIRLIKATIKRFVEYCQHQGFLLHERNFSIRYQTNIPRNVGLAGSSAIIVAALRCLMEFYQVAIPQHLLPSLALSVETDELNIAAGLQDRVVQVYEGLVAMDFSPQAMREESGLRYGMYEPLDAACLPPLYLAYSADPSSAEPTEVPHSDLRARWQRRDADVVQAMQRLAELTDRDREALLACDHKELARLMDENFNIRRSLFRNMLPRQLEMVEQARSIGASAKFAGSGGAIIGACEGEEMFARLTAVLAPLGCAVVRPQVLP